MRNVCYLSVGCVRTSGTLLHLRRAEELRITPRRCHHLALWGELPRAVSSSTFLLCSLPRVLRPEPRGRPRAFPPPRRFVPSLAVCGCALCLCCVRAFLCMHNTIGAHSHHGPLPCPPAFDGYRYLLQNYEYDTTLRKETKRANRCRKEIGKTRRLSPAKYVDKSGVHKYRYAVVNYAYDLVTTELTNRRCSRQRQVCAVTVGPGARLRVTVGPSSRSGAIHSSHLGYVGQTAARSTSSQSSTTRPWSLKSRWLPSLAARAGHHRAGQERGVLSLLRPRQLAAPLWRIPFEDVKGSSHKIAESTATVEE